MAKWNSWLPNSTRTKTLCQTSIPNPSQLARCIAIIYSSLMSWYEGLPPSEHFSKKQICVGDYICQGRVDHKYLSGTSILQLFVRDKKITIIYQGRGSSHRLCLPHVPPPCEQTNQAARPRGTIQLVLVFVFFCLSVSVLFLIFLFPPPLYNCI